MAKIKRQVAKVERLREESRPQGKPVPVEPAHENAQPVSGITIIDDHSQPPDGVLPEDGPYDDWLEKQTVKDLRAMAADRNIPGRSKMTKQELVEALS